MGAVVGVGIGMALDWGIDQIFNACDDSGVTDNAVNGIANYWRAQSTQSAMNGNGAYNMTGPGYIP